MSDDAPTRDRDTENSGRRTTRRQDAGEDYPRGVGARTSGAAVFSLVFGLIALLAALTGLLAPVAVLFGLIGLVLGIFGIRAGKRPLTAGKNIAISGLIMAGLALLLGVAAIAGFASAVSSNPQILDQITNLVNTARSQVPGA